MTTDRMSTAFADAFSGPSDPVGAEGEGGGRPTGLQACPRAILTGTQSDDKWAASVGLWDRLRADIRRLSRDQEVAAWQLAFDALSELRADFDQQFGDHIEKKKKGRDR